MSFVEIFPVTEDAKSKQTFDENTLYGAAREKLTVVEQLETQLSVLNSRAPDDNASPPDSSFLYGTKPAWDRDYVLCFKLPKAMARKLDAIASYQRRASTGTPASSPSHAGRRRKGCCFKRPGGVEHEGSGGGNNDDDDDDDDDDDWDDEVDPEVEVIAPKRKKRDLTRRRVEILARLKSAGFVFSQIVVPSQNVILVRMPYPSRK